MVLDRFTGTYGAANIPEFVPLPADAIAEIKERFLDAYSFLRAGMANERTGNYPAAVKAHMLMDSGARLLRILHELGATHLLVPSLGEFGDQFIVTTKFIDVSAAKVLHRKVYYVDNTEQALLEGVRKSVRELATSQGWATTEPPGAGASGGGGSGTPAAVGWGAVGTRWICAGAGARSCGWRRASSGCSTG